jgi:hypothetical protein
MPIILSDEHGTGDIAQFRKESLSERRNKKEVI